MTTPNPNEPAVPAPQSSAPASESSASASEKSDHDAASPPTEPRPDSPVSQRPEFPTIQAIDAPLNPVTTKPIRPPALNAPRPPPKPSSAPAPRLRPNAPFTRAGDAEFSPRAPDSPLSAADDLAGALSPGTSSQPAFFEAADSASLADAVVHAPSRRSLPAGHDPFFYRKASIPILLTFAVLPFVAAIVLGTTGEDNALPALFPPWTPLALLSISAICLTLAVLNMLAMRNAK